MPVSLRDAHLRAFAQTVEQSGSRPKLGDAQVVELILALTDFSPSDISSVRSVLGTPGYGPSQRFALAQSVLDDDERADLAELLDHSGWDMEDSARNLIAALLGRETLCQTSNPLRVVGDQKSGLSGKARPGEVVEVVNLSTASARGARFDDSFELGRAGADGAFAGSVPDLREGDQVKLRARAADGSTSDWLTIAARGLEAEDTRNAFIDAGRLEFKVDPGGIIVTQKGAAPLSEPDAKLCLTNRTTGSQTVVSLRDGNLPSALWLRGAVGNEISVAISDGRNNLDFKDLAGTVRVGVSRRADGVVEVVDPGPQAEHQRADHSSTLPLTRYTGPLFIDGPKMDDVDQGYLGDCYLCAAVASIANTHPELLERALKDNGDGTYTARFIGLAGVPEEVVVDGDLYAEAAGPEYGRSPNGGAPDKMELWFPLLEKAFAQWVGGYAQVDVRQGSGVDVMHALTGKAANEVSVMATSKDALYAQIRAAAGSSSPMTAHTYVGQEARYTNTGVIGEHAYSVLGAQEENGVKYVLLRNPWGMTEPAGNGPDDGQFRLPLDTFVSLYQSVQTGTV